MKEIASDLEGPDHGVLNLKMVLVEPNVKLSKLKGPGRIKKTTTY